MKLSLIFLLCLVCYGATYHQRPQYRNLRTYYQPRFAFHYPAIVNDDSLYFTPTQDFKQVEDYSEDDSLALSDLSDYADDTEARGPVRRPAGYERPQSKLLWNNQLISQLLSSKSRITILPTFTSTILQTITSTVTTASIKSCIGTAQFANIAAAAGPPVVVAATSTQPCVRRRRGINYEEKMAIEALELVPSPVEALETSIAPEMAPSSRNRRSEHQLEIVSSQDTPIETEQRSVNNRQKRNVITTVTATVTTFSFVATPVVKSFTLAGPAAAGGGQGLFCLPAGFTVC